MFSKTISKNFIHKTKIQNKKIRQYCSKMTSVLCFALRIYFVDFFHLKDKEQIDFFSLMTTFFCSRDCRRIYPSSSVKLQKSIIFGLM